VVPGAGLEPATPRL